MSVNIYKSIKISDLKNRTVKPVSATDKAKVNEIVTKFITYLKAAHR